MNVQLYFNLFSCIYSFINKKVIYLLLLTNYKTLNPQIMKFIPNQKYIRLDDKRVPLIYTGEKKTTTSMGEDFTYYQFREEITKGNKNWCKGELIWSLGSGIVDLSSNLIKEGMKIRITDGYNDLTYEIYRSTIKAILVNGNWIARSLLSYHSTVKGGDTLRFIAPDWVAKKIGL